ncbi:hypothetical protein [Natrialba magadii]|uniref:hypothetical protein n=1 Tax=Natrialba magadii TaxID=13769 RepID=UPI0006779528|nr:hypothetical protein [Natrialba magadii]
MKSNESPNAAARGGNNVEYADGQEQVRSYAEVKRSRDTVRSYSAGGRLYAYREDDEHVVVSCGQEPQTQWVKRVQAERTTVEENEKLWTIPENWNHQLTVRETDLARYWVYRIPETNVDLKVAVPTNDRLVDAWYQVKEVGTLTAKYDDECNWDRLDELIKDARAEDWETAVVEALDEIAANGEQIEQELVEEVNLSAVGAVKAGRDVTPSFDGWIVDPWVETWHQYYTDILETVLTEQNSDADTQTDAINIVLDANVLPASPRVRLQIDDH